MLKNTQDLYGHKLVALDGDIGHIRDFYFDDKSWVIRYLIADTGGWLPGRLVLLSPHAFGKWSTTQQALEIKLTKLQITKSPSIDAHKPVSRQNEIEYYQYYGWPNYWDGSALWGFGGYPLVLPLSKDEMDVRLHHHRDDKHLQSAHAVTGYQLHATDGVMGTVLGFLVDPKSWAIRDVVVEAGHWYSAKQILVSTDKIEAISYQESKVFVALARADLQRTMENKLAHAGKTADIL